MRRRETGRNGLHPAVRAIEVIDEGASILLDLHAVVVQAHAGSLRCLPNEQARRAGTLEIILVLQELILLEMHYVVEILEVVN